MRKFKGLANRSISTENNDEDNVVDQVGGGADSLETDLLDVQNEHQEIQEKEEMVDDGVEAANELEEDIAVAQEALNEGGMNQVAARWFTKNMQRHASRLGLDYVGYGMPSAEAFGGASSRISANQRSLEGAKEMLRQAWEAILKYIRKAYDWTMKFFEKVFGAATKLGTRATALQERLNNLPSGAPKPDFEDNSIFEALCGSNGDIANPAAGAATVQTVVTNILKNWNERVGSYADHAVTFFDAAANNKTFSNLTPIDPAYFAGQAVSDPEGAGFTKPAHTGMSLYRSEELPGNKAIVGILATNRAAIDINSEDGREMINAQTIRLEDYNPNFKKPTTAKKLKTLEAGAMNKICNSVKSVSDSIVAFKGSAQKMRDFKKKLGDSVANLAKAAEGLEEKDADKRPIMNFLKNYATRFLNQVDHPAVDVNKYALTTGKKYLDYVEKSMDQYGKKD